MTKVSRILLERHDLKDSHLNRCSSRFSVGTIMERHIKVNAGRVAESARNTACHGTRHICNVDRADGRRFRPSAS